MLGVCERFSGIVVLIMSSQFSYKVFTLLLMGGFIQGRNLLSYDDSILQPIITQSGRTRMCYELCTSGLGGAPCGDSCFDLIPLNLPVSGSSQVQNTTTDSGVKYNVTTRADSCDVLCKNGLGYPLCSCTNVEKSATTDFFEICTVFCVNYNYQISGCQKCNVYTERIAALTNFTLNVNQTVSLSQKIDYKLWCERKCQTASFGGAACNCELLAG